MTHVIAYTYLADSHTPDEARDDWRAGVLMENNHNPYALPPSLGVDEHGLPYNLQDADGNLIHPVFDTDESAS